MTCSCSITLPMICHECQLAFSICIIISFVVSIIDCVSQFVFQICDFGLAKWLPKQWTHHNVSKFEGTFGFVSVEYLYWVNKYFCRNADPFVSSRCSYFAPEYFMHGIVDEKTDVYAFGVLLLELITGRKALDHQQQSVVIWVNSLMKFDESNHTIILKNPYLALLFLVGKATSGWEWY